VQKHIILQRFLTAIPVRMEAAKKRPELNSLIISVDPATGKALAARRYSVAAGY